MIKLKNDGQFAEFYDRYGLDRPTNLCQLINKTFWFSLFLTFIGFLGVVFLVGTTALLFGMWPYWVAHGALLEWVLIVFVGCMYGYHKWRETHPTQWERPQWQQNIGAAYDGLKERFCPLVRFE